MRASGERFFSFLQKKNNNWTCQLEAKDNFSNNVNNTNSDTQRLLQNLCICNLEERNPTQVGSKLGTQTMRAHRRSANEAATATEAAKERAYNIIEMGIQVHQTRHQYDFGILFSFDEIDSCKPIANTEITICIINESASSCDGRDYK